MYKTFQEKRKKHTNDLRKQNIIVEDTTIITIKVREINIIVRTYKVTNFPTSTFNR